MADKYLPELQELTSLTDDDLFYIVGGGDYKTTLKNLRILLNPSDDAIPEIVTYNIPVNELYGNWFSNNGAVGPISLNLPAVQDGLYLGVMVETAQYLFITPYLSDVIVGMTSFGGQPIKSNVVGDSIVLRSTSNNWHVWKLIGSWSI